MDPQLTSAETVASQPGVVSSHVSHAEDGRFAPGTLLNGRYRVSGLLGRGGMGEVYRALDLTLGQSVALKFLPEFEAGDTRLLERFHREVRVARQVSHPNVCRVYDIGEVDGIPFISMEYVDGEDLASLLQRIGRLPADKALEISRKICAGLAAAHDKGIIHRDIKPQNIMLNKRGEAVIMDFGLAAVAGSLTGAEARNGTPAYMSPEQLKGLEATAKSDIYSLGVVLYELFTGKRPYDARTVQAMIDMQESQQMPSMTSVAADIDPAVEKAVKRCLDPDPARRPSTAMSVAAVLPGGDPLAAALAAGETLSPEAVANAGSSAGLDRKWAILCLAVAIACLASAIYLRDRWATYLQTRLDLPPDVLRLKSRETAAMLGYPVKPADSWIRLYSRPGLMAYWQGRNPQPGDWKKWCDAEAPVSSFYREAPEPLITWPNGFVSPAEPPPMAPGMAQVELDGHGRLRGFLGVPYETQSQSPTSAIEPEAIFRAVGLDISKFEEKQANSLPRSASDRIRSWKGTHPALADTPLTVEIAWWKHQVTWVKLIWPWMSATGATPDRAVPLLVVLRLSIVVAFWIAGAVLAILLARRNWRLGRVDKAGAAKLAIVQVLLVSFVWIGYVHPIPNVVVMFDYYVHNVSDGLLNGFIIWLLYLALEPTLRARWPQAVITWNRLLAGRFGDPQVAADILIGAALGMGIWTAASLISPRMETPTLFPLMGARQWLEMLPGIIRGSLLFSMVVLFVLFCLRWVLKREWLAALAGALLFALSERNLSNLGSNWQVQYVIYVFAYAAIAFVLLRLGLVATLSCLVFIDLMGDFVLGTDLTVWHASTGIATLVLILSLVLVAFWKSLGSRDLLDGTAGAQ